MNPNPKLVMNSDSPERERIPVPTVTASLTLKTKILKINMIEPKVYIKIFNKLI